MIVRAIILLSLVVSGLVVPPAGTLPATAAAASVSAPAAAPALAASAVTAGKPRAVVAGSYQLLSDGKVRVSLSSTSTRVKLTWRTAKNKKRAATVRVRKGAAVKTLPKGSKKIVAQARATKKLRAGTKTPIPAYSPPTVTAPMTPAVPSPPPTPSPSTPQPPAPSPPPPPPAQLPPRVPTLSAVRITASELWLAWSVPEGTTAVALQARDPGPGRDHYRRKIAEHKTVKEARRSLKRRITNAVYRCILADQERLESRAA